LDLEFDFDVDAVVAEAEDVEGPSPPLMAFLEKTEKREGEHGFDHHHHRREANQLPRITSKIYLRDEEVVVAITLRLRLDIVCVAVADADVAIAVAMAMLAFLLASRFEPPRTEVILGTTMVSANHIDHGQIIQMWNRGRKKSLKLRHT